MMNRRRFLATAASVVAAMATGCARAPQPAGGPPSAERPLRVALLSDVHLQPDDGALLNRKLTAAVRDLGSLEPDLWITNGDIADHGAASELEAFKRIMAKAAPADRILVTTGNHEFYDMQTTDDVSISRWKQAFGVEQLYTSRLFGGLHFVLLADEMWKLAPYNKDWCWITPEQVSWFDRVLAEHRDKFTVVCMHQPLNDTVAGSMGERAFGGTNMSRELYEILGRNPQARLWFSGHTHRKPEVAGQVAVKTGVTFMGLGSTAYMLGPKPGGGSGRDTDASQSRMLEIFPDRVRVLTRDHVAGQWLGGLEQTLQRT